MLVQPGKEAGELRDGKSGRCPSAKKNGFGCGPTTEEFGLADDGVHQGVRFARSSNLFIKAAVGANLEAEGDVDIEVRDRRLTEVCSGRTASSTALRHGVGGRTHGKLEAKRVDRPTHVLFRDVFCHMRLP